MIDFELTSSVWQFFYRAALPCGSFYLYTLRQDKGGIPLRAERCTGPAFTLITARQPKCESELDTELADERARTGSAAITRAAPVNSHFILEVKEPLRHV